MTEAVFPDLSRETLVGVDTETTGVGHTARAIGLGIAIQGQDQRYYFSWGAGRRDGRDGPPAMNNCSLAAVQAWAARELTQRSTTYVAHYAAFDQRMLAYSRIPARAMDCTQTAAVLLDEHRPKFSLNALAAEYGLGAKADTDLHAWMARNLRGIPPGGGRKACAPHYWRVPVEIMAPYGAQDPALTRALFATLSPLLDAKGCRRVYALEIALLPVLLRMHLAGVRIDRPRAQRVKADLGIEQAALLDRWRAEFGDANYRSPDDLGRILDRLGIAYPLTEKSRKPSITKEFLDGLAHPIGKTVRSLRRLSHFRDTFIESYLLANCSEAHDVIHPEFHALKGDEYGTISGRLSSGGQLNVQNIPARDSDWASLIRSLFRPMRDSQVWFRADYSQIEYRFFAHYAGTLARAKSKLGRSAMEEAYLSDPAIDFHQWVAETCRIPRKMAKNVNFCKLYGGGIKKIAKTAGISEAEAAAFDALYEREIPEAKSLSDDITSAAQRRGFVRTWQGRILRFKRDGGRYAMTHAALNRVLQGSSADLTKLAMIEVDKSIDWDSTQMHLTVHDELDFSIERDLAEPGAIQLATIMQDVARTPAWNGTTLRVPVRVETELGQNWGMLP